MGGLPAIESAHWRSQPLPCAGRCIQCPTLGRHVDSRYIAAVSIRSFAADLLPSALQPRAARSMAAKPLEPAEVATVSAQADKHGYKSKAEHKKVREAIN